MKCNNIPDKNLKVKSRWILGNMLIPDKPKKSQEKLFQRKKIKFKRLIN